jgi:hypothetical protein
VVQHSSAESKQLRNINRSRPLTSPLHRVLTWTPKLPKIALLVQVSRCANLEQRNGKSELRRSRLFVSSLSLQLPYFWTSLF